MCPEGNDYHSYMLRLWRVKDDGDNWRASLEEVQTGVLHGFTDLTALMRYLAALGCPNQQEGEAFQEQQQD